MTEIQVQRKIKKKLEGLGWTVIRLTVTGVGGMPDLLALKDQEIPTFIEVKKTKGGIVSKLQEYQIKQMRKKGFRAFVANSWELVEETIYGQKKEN